VKSKRETMEKIAALIRRSASAAVLCHMHPDGDALGSMLGLALALERLGKRVHRVSPDGVPPPYDFLPGSRAVRRRLPRDLPPLAIVVDCDGLARLGPLARRTGQVAHVVAIDHHATGKAFGALRWVDPSAAAVGALLSELVAALGVPFDREIATCLYTAILTDTGRFSYTNTTARALRIAARLVQAGADPGAIYQQVYETKSLAQAALLGAALSRLSTADEGRIVLSALTRADFAATGANDSDTEGIIDQIRAVRQAEVAVLLVERGGEVRCSMRSRGRADVARVAEALGGGGHPQAAGCTVAGPLARARKQAIRLIAAELGPRA